jgi:hypothetical protein
VTLLARIASRTPIPTTRTMPPKSVSSDTPKDSNRRRLGPLTFLLHFAQRCHTARGNTENVRRLLVPICVLALLAPAASAGEAQRGDGTLSIRDGRGTVVVQARGAVIGQLTRLERNGKLVIDDLTESDDAEPRVVGADWARERPDGTLVYGGKAIRFRLIGGRFVLRITNAVGLQLSVVGKGKVTLDGAGSLENGIIYDGVYSLNGEETVSLPDEPVTLRLGPSATAFAKSGDSSSG